MLPKAHFVLGFLFAAVLFCLFPDIGLIGALIIWASSVLIDVDHYTWYVSKGKDFSLRKAYNYDVLKGQKMAKLSREERNKYKNEILFLHGFEPLLAIYLLSFIWPILFFVFIGFVYHLLTDIYYEISRGYRVDKISLIYDIINYKKLKKIKL